LIFILFWRDLETKGVRWQTNFASSEGPTGSLVRGLFHYSISLA